MAQKAGRGRAGKAAAAPARPGVPAGASASAATQDSGRACDLILDVELVRGVLHFVLATIGTQPVHAVRARFSRTIRDLSGASLNDSPLFTQLEFLGPGRRVPMMIDALAAYRQRRQPMRFDVRLAWRGDDGRSHARVITHDLDAWLSVREMI